MRTKQEAGGTRLSAEVTSSFRQDYLTENLLIHTLFHMKRRLLCPGLDPVGRGRLRGGGTERGPARLSARGRESVSGARQGGDPGGIRPGRDHLAGCCHQLPVPLLLLVTLQGRPHSPPASHSCQNQNLAFAKWETPRRSGRTTGSKPESLNGQEVSCSDVNKYQRVRINRAGRLSSFLLFIWLFLLRVDVFYRTSSCAFSSSQTSCSFNSGCS